MRKLRIVGAVFGVLLLVGGALLGVAYRASDRLRALGGEPDAYSWLRIRASPQFHVDHFENHEPTSITGGLRPSVLLHWLFGREQRVPTCPLPMVHDAKSRLAEPSSSGLRITWLGHSTTLIELDGVKVLTDPQWSERASPVDFAGPRRFHPPPLALADLPKLDAVVISHEHYDHLDRATVQQLAQQGAHFHVPLGMRAHLLLWGVPNGQINEHDWWQGVPLPGAVELIAVPSRHFNGRGRPGGVGALWTSWTLIGPEHRVFFSGDTGPSQDMREIAALQGPFDVALLEIGQWDASWGDIHLGPTAALEAARTLHARRLLPIHWATFELAFHAWSEPAETLLREAGPRGMALVMPMLGEPVEPTLGEAGSTWWRNLPPIAASCP
ncbi:MAG: MBL fold metallo-hydrolase [Polyangiales bacterium]